MEAKPTGLLLRGIRAYSFLKEWTMRENTRDKAPWHLSDISAKAYHIVKQTKMVCGVRSERYPIPELRRAHPVGKKNGEADLE
jgi:hypothetical protein